MEVWSKWKSGPMSRFSTKYGRHVQFGVVLLFFNFQFELCEILISFLYIDCMSRATLSTTKLIFWLLI